MKANRELLEDHSERCGARLRELKSYINELKAKTAEYGTDPIHFKEDLAEAEHNVKYYEGEIARCKGELKGLPAGAGPARAGADSILPRTAKQGVGSVVLSSISFAVGALLGSKLKSGRGGKGGAG